MPDITITVTAGQAQRIAAAFGPKPIELTQEQWVVKNTKAFYKERVRAAESQSAANVAFDTARDQVDTDFGGF
jgi:hypothetical protein